ncbi:MAG: hypothetical protein IGR80_17930 [Synechococcales cyanobacterium K44_A2020_017]|nr:hypothetical protein [Synechococcales cyanobacterium K32_A2020_035]MBF2096619.1 hypothetical protein [Synechococcales cyanobacterium K44_A2020_017]
MARLQHYLFSHKRLPRLFQDSPLQFVEKMRSAQAQMFLLRFWKAIAEEIDLDDEDIVDPAGLKLTSKEAEDYEIIVVSLPPPTISPEAYFIGVWVSYSKAHEGAPFRYFTLELEEDLGRDDDSSIGSPTTVFCEWTETGEHLNYGDGLAPKVEAFIEAIAALQVSSTTKPINPAREALLAQALRSGSSISDTTRQSVCQTDVNAHSFFMRENSRMVNLNQDKLSSINTIVETTGLPVNNSYGVLSPGTGKTTLTLKSNRVVEQTQYRFLGLQFGTRHCEVPIHQVDSFELLEKGNPIWATLAIIALPGTLGIGTIFFGLLFFLLKKRYLVIRSNSNTLAIMINSAMDMERARAFMDEMIKVCDHLTSQI